MARLSGRSLRRASAPRSSPQCRPGETGAAHHSRACAILGTLRAITYSWLLALVALIRSLVSLWPSRRGLSSDDEHERKRAPTRCVPINDPLRVRLERYQRLIASPFNRVGREPGIQ
jgi:hypothetical protein